MRSTSDVEGARANANASDNGRTQAVTAENGSDDRLWFARPARELLGVDAGYALHILTEKDIPESTCYRVLRGDNPPSSYLLRKLLWRKDGWPWLEIVMDGCESEWWRELRKARRAAEIMRGE